METSQTACRKPMQVIPFEFAAPVGKSSTPGVTCPVVMASINNSAPMPFIVDTGYNSRVLLYRWAARMLELEGIPARASAPTGKVKAESVNLKNMVLIGADGVGIETNISTALVLENQPSDRKLDGTRIAGNVGTLAFSCSSLCFDFDRNNIILSPSQSDAYHTAAQLLPDIEKGRFYTRASLKPNITTEFLIDTGSESSHLVAEYRDRVIHEGQRDIKFKSLS